MIIKNEYIFVWVDSFKEFLIFNKTYTKNVYTCVWMYTWVQVPSESRKGSGVRGLCEQQDIDAGTEFWFSRRAGSTLFFSMLQRNLLRKYAAISRTHKIL